MLQAVEEEWTSANIIVKSVKLLSIHKRNWTNILKAINTKREALIQLQTMVGINENILQLQGKVILKFYNILRPAGQSATLQAKGVSQ